MKAFGQVKIEVLSAKAKSERSRAESDANELQNIAVQMETERGKAAQARLSATVKRDELATVVRQIRDVSDFQTNYDVHVTSWTEIVESKIAEEKRFGDSLNELLSRKPEIEKQIREKSIAASKHGLEAQRYFELLAELQDVDKEFDAAAVLNAQPRVLAELLTLYKAAREALEAAERRQTAPLLVRKEAAEQALTVANTRYAEVGVGLPVSEVGALLHVNFRSERTKAGEGLDVTKASRERCLTAQGAASGKLDDFRRGRKYPSHVIASINEVSDANIAAALSEGPHRCPYCQ
ncbi:hypothetical protein ACTMU2_17995 [Cupriavidus basilensis]